MVLNPMGMLSKEQQAQLVEIQKYTKFITAKIVQEGNTLTITLNTDNLEAVKGIPQIQAAMIDSVASCLFSLFQIQGTVKKEF